MFQLHGYFIPPAYRSRMRVASFTIKPTYAHMA